MRTQPSRPGVRWSCACPAGQHDGLSKHNPVGLAPVGAAPARPAGLNSLLGTGWRSTSTRRQPSPRGRRRRDRTRQVWAPNSDSRRRRLSVEPTTTVTEGCWLERWRRIPATRRPSSAFTALQPLPSQARLTGCVSLVLGVCEACFQANRPPTVSCLLVLGARLTGRPAGWRAEQLGTRQAYLQVSRSAGEGAAGHRGTRTQGRPHVAAATG